MYRNVMRMILLSLLLKLRIIFLNFSAIMHSFNLRMICLPLEEVCARRNTDLFQDTGVSFGWNTAGREKLGKRRALSLAFGGIVAHTSDFHAASRGINSHLICHLHCDWLAISPGVESDFHPKSSRSTSIHPIIFLPFQGHKKLEMIAC